MAFCVEGGGREREADMEEVLVGIEGCRRGSGGVGDRKVEVAKYISKWDGKVDGRCRS